MIGSLNGKVLRVDGVTALIEVNGVGYEVDMPVTCLNSIKKDSTVFIFIQHVVREDAQVLYGFNTYDERALFRELVKVNGVGPKMALSVLSTFSVEDFINTLIANQSKALEQIPGVGKKTAERMLVELKDCVKKFSDGLAITTMSATAAQSANSNFNDAVAAMTALGYKEFEAVKCVKAVLKDNNDLSTQQIIVGALALITKGRA
ncbi:MAG: Holliday junction branch migration protein RuvA [Aeromonadales bacterium]|nr:Holliday junction branch migration protein RuvA [Aeromonadales bacterium]